MVDLEPEISIKKMRLNLQKTSLQLNSEMFTSLTPTPRYRYWGYHSRQKRRFPWYHGPHRSRQNDNFETLDEILHPDSGDLLINGKSLSDYTLDSVRDKIGFVSQEPFLFYGSVKDNVVYNQTANDEELQRVLNWQALGNLFKN